MKHMTWKKQPVLRKHMTWKKRPVLMKHLRWKREKKEVTSETAYCISLKERRYFFCRKSFFSTKHLKSKKGNIWSGQTQNLKQKFYIHATSNCWKSSKCRIYSHTIPAAGMVWGFTECSLTSLPNPTLFPPICLCWWKHHMMEKTPWIESQGFSLTNDRFRNSFDETYEVKKGNQFGWNIWDEKGKKK